MMVPLYPSAHIRSMARVFPDGWRELASLGGAIRELQTLDQLADGLDESYTVYHAVHWTRVERNNYAIVGEIDFVIVGPTGKLLLIEQKAGSLNETADGLTKPYADKEKSIPFQMARSVDALHSRLRRFCKGEQTYLDSLLYCPDYTVRQPGTAGIDPARIVDATKKDYLMQVIRGILPSRRRPGCEGKDSSVSGRYPGACPRSALHGRGNQDSLYTSLWRSRAVGSQYRVRTISPARGWYCWVRKDAARDGDLSRCGSGWPTTTLCLL